MIINITFYKDTPTEILMLFICKVVTSIGNFIYPLLSLYLTIKLGLTNMQAGTILTFISLIYIPGTLIGGFLGDYYNKKYLIVFLQICASLCLGFTIFISSNILKIITIGLSSFFLTLTQPILDSFISDFAITETQRRNSYSLLYLGFNLGSALGIFLGGKLFNNYINLLFIFDSITTFLSSLMIFFFLKEKKILNMTQKRKEKSLISFTKLNKILFLFSCFGTIYFFVYFQVNFSLPLFLSHIFLENGPSFYGDIMALNSIMVIIFTPLFTQYLKRYSALTNLILSGILFSIGFGLNYFAKSILDVGLFSIIWTSGEIIFFTNYLPFIITQTTSNEKTRQIAISTIILRIGYYLNPVISGKLLSIIAPQKQWVIIFIVMILGTILMIFLKILQKNIPKNNLQNSN